MSEEPAPGRIVVIWSPEARADLRGIDREPAMQILYCIDRYLTNRAGDVKKLKLPLTGFRLRCGDHRVFFDLKGRKHHRDHRRPESSRSLSLKLGEARKLMAALDMSPMFSRSFSDSRAASSLLSYSQSTAL